MISRNRFKISKISWMGVLISLIIIILLKSFFEQPERDLTQMVSNVLGYLEFGNHNRFINTIVSFLIPQIAVLAIWGDYFNENILRNYNIIFTRTRNIKRIVTKYVLELILGVSSMVFVFETVICIIYIIKGYYLNDVQNLFMALLLYLMYMNLILVLVNIFSLFMKSIFSNLMILVVQLIAFESIYFLKTKESLSLLYYFIPTSVSIVYENITVNMFTKILWAIYLFVIIVVSICLGIVAIKKKEFIN